MAEARSPAVKVCFLSSPWASPRKIWERMTPELPRAPSSAPCESFAAMMPAEVSSLASIARIAACMVADILEPVSPSGTGKTLSALMASRCSASHAAPLSMAFFKSCPSKTLMRRGRRGCNEVVARGVCSCMVDGSYDSVLFLLYALRRVRLRRAVAQALHIDIDLCNRYTQHFFN